MDARPVNQAGFRYSLVLLALLCSTLLFTSGCDSPPKTFGCPGALQPYQGKCMSAMAINYAGCTEGKGVSSTDEITTGVGGTLEVVTDASLKVAYKKAQQEDTPVALEIVKDCMEIARRDSAASDPEQSTAAKYQRKIDQDLQQWQPQPKQTALPGQPKQSLVPVLFTISSTASPPSLTTATCPAVITFTGTVDYSGPGGTFQYVWLRSDGATQTTPGELTFKAAGRQTISTTWTLGAPVSAFQPFNGWEQLKMMSPVVLSNPSTFTLNCTGSKG
jgi:hypothetical protein